MTITKFAADVEAALKTLNPERKPVGGYGAHDSPAPSSVSEKEREVAQPQLLDEQQLLAQADIPEPKEKRPG